MRRITTTAIASIALTLVSACGSNDESGAATTAATEAAAPTTEAAATTTEAPTTTAAPTTAAPTTTDAPTTTAAPTTTVAPLTVADLTLMGTTVGPVAFGTGAAAALDVLVPLLGPPATDETATFPTDDGYGSFINEDEESIFTYPFLRRTCFDNGFCMSFGGAAPETVQFVGFEYFTAEEPADPALVTAQGVPIGARWSDHLDGMTAQGGGCYSQGSGESAGVTLVLASSGALFGTFEGETYTTAVPDPADVTVYGMYAGSNRGYLYADC